MHTTQLATSLRVGSQRQVFVTASVVQPRMYVNDVLLCARMLVCVPMLVHVLMFVLVPVSVGVVFNWLATG